MRVWWLIGACCSALGAALFVVGLWISSTVPGTYGANNWGSDNGAQIAIVIFLLGALGMVIGFLTCATLLIMGGIRLRRCSGDDRRSRMNELAWNATGVLIPVVVIATSSSV